MRSNNNTFSDYMMLQPVNKSINLSPSSGKLHKQRQSGYGPTIYLMNKSGINNEVFKSTKLTQNEQLIQKLLMLSIENERIHEINKQLQLQIIQIKNNFSNKGQIYQLQQHIQRLKKHIDLCQKQKIDIQQRLNRNINQLRQRLSIYQLDNKNTSRLIQQYQLQIQDLKKIKLDRQAASEKAKLQTSRLEMSMQFNTTNIDLHKSMIKQKNQQLQNLRQKIGRLQQIINDQKFIINSQKDDINRQKIKINQIQLHYQNIIEDSKRNYQSGKKNQYQGYNDQNKRLNNIIKQLKNQIVITQSKLKQKQNQQLKQTKELKQSQEKTFQLQKKLQDIQFKSHSIETRAEESIKLTQKQKQRQISKYKKEIQGLKQQIQRYKIQIQQLRKLIIQKNNQLQQNSLLLHLKNKQQQIKNKRGRKRLIDIGESRINKSLSSQTLIMGNRFRSSVNLSNIVNSVMELKSANDRTTKIISRSYATAKQSYYA